MSRLPQNSIEIRSAREEDFPAMVAFVAMIQEYEREVLPNRRLGGLIAVPYAHHLKAKTAEPGGLLLIACAAQAPVGFIAGYLNEDPDDLIEPETRPHGYVSDLFVLPNWRRMGLASRMIAHAEAHFRGQGMKRLRINGVAVNKAAMGLYENAGFRSYKVVFEKNIPVVAHEISANRQARNGNPNA